MKEFACTIAGAIGGFLSYFFGGWSSALTTLIIFMAIDYITGSMVAGVFNKSTKTEHGALDSRVGWEGLCKKCVTLFLVLVAVRLDIVAGTTFFKDGAVMGFVLNEALSIIENASLMGVKFPKRITKAIEVLKGKTEQDGE